jgi:acyl-coenzyme A synthetase/AMP-(fatty) acid ligase
MHTTGGYLLEAALTVKYVFDIHPEDKFACMADVGWITGHTYVECQDALRLTLTQSVLHTATSFTDLSRTVSQPRKIQASISLTGV